MTEFGLSTSVTAAANNAVTLDFGTVGVDRYIPSIEASYSGVATGTLTLTTDNVITFQTSVTGAAPTVRNPNWLIPRNLPSSLQLSPGGLTIIGRIGITIAS